MHLQNSGWLPLSSRYILRIAGKVNDELHLTADILLDSG